MPGAYPGGDNVTGEGFTIGLGIEPQLDDLIDNLQFTSSLLDDVEQKFLAVADSIVSVDDRVKQLSRDTEDYSQVVDRVRGSMEGMLQSGQAALMQGQGFGGGFAGYGYPGAAGYGVSPYGIPQIQGGISGALGGVFGGPQTPTTQPGAGGEIEEEGGESEQAAETGAERAQEASGENLFQKSFAPLFLIPQYKEMLNRLQNAGGKAEKIHAAFANLGRKVSSMGPKIRQAFPGAEAPEVKAPSVATDMEGNVLSGASSVAPEEGLVGKTGGAAALGEGTAAMYGAATVAAPLAVGYVAYRGITGAMSLSNSYAQMTGGQRDLGAAAGYEARIRMMSLSPFLNDQQARQIVYATLQGGYQGSKADTVMKFIADNVKTGVLSVSDSMTMYKNVVEDAKGTTDGLSNALDGLRDVAAKTSGSVSGITDIYKAQTTGAISIGINGNTASQIGQLQASIGQGGPPGLREYQGPDLTNQFYQQQLGVYWQIPYTQVPQAIQGTGAGGVAKANYAVARQMLINLGLQPGMSRQELLALGEQKLQQVGQYLSMYGVITQEEAANQTTLMEIIQGYLGATPGQTPRLNPASYLAKQTQANAPAAHLTESQATNLANKYAPTGSSSFLGKLVEGPGTQMQAEIGDWYSSYIQRNKTTLPLLGQLLRNDTAGTTVVRPAGLPVMSLRTYLQNYPGKAAGELRAGTIRIAQIPANLQSQYGLDSHGGGGDLAGLLSNQGALNKLHFMSGASLEGDVGSTFPGATKPQHVTVTLSMSPTMARYFNANVAGSDWSPGGGVVRSDALYGRGGQSNNGSSVPTRGKNISDGGD